MHFKVEKTGCSVRKGMVQVRYCLYLDPEDSGYEKTYYKHPIQSYVDDGYKGDVDEKGIPLDILDYNKWWDSLPTEWVHAEFHNHFVQLEPNVTDAEILYVGELALKIAKEKWDKDEFPAVKNQPFIKPKITQERIDLCEAKLVDIKSKTLENLAVV